MVVGGVGGFGAVWAAMCAQLGLAGVGAAWIRLTVFWTCLTSLRISFRFGSLAAASWRRVMWSWKISLAAPRKFFIWLLRAEGLLAIV